MTVTTIDEATGQVIVRDASGERVFDLASPEAFEAASKAWLRAGWDVKHAYSFTWMGRPIIQLPEDMIRMAEVIWRLKPDVIVETGVAHGGSLIFYASLFEAMGHGQVIGVDIEIRPHNRAAIEAHAMARRIEMIEGSSTSPAVVAQLKERLRPDQTALVILNSNHSRQHVLGELRALGDFASVGSYIVATDGIMQDLVGAPRSSDDWASNNPQQAALAFVAEDERFVIEEPAWLFNEGSVRSRVTHWPNAFVKRIR